MRLRVFSKSKRYTKSHKNTRKLLATQLRRVLTESKSTPHTVTSCPSSSEDGVNQPTDAYGGSIENRVRLLEVVDAVIQAAGSSRVAISELNKHGLAYLQLIEPRSASSTVTDVNREQSSGIYHDDDENLNYFRKMWKAPLITTGLGMPIVPLFISNPNLVKKVKLNMPFSKYIALLFVRPAKWKVTLIIRCTRTPKDQLLSKNELYSWNRYQDARAQRICRNDLPPSRTPHTMPLAKAPDTGTERGRHQFRPCLSAHRPHMLFSPR
ncbi:hypothetical protein BC938DRAFT_475474 [Jimgerdemannia flammicorona]|uniref:NADH:flavin oxidoreductase/NADH oxidase N-terminal domain-containing protein n=1 Tax=Jimgerdemannia flammicorona TaxID=994334 RepID=A0A433QRN3_9FUNG|nr:hypothetical protein BC938DRAFT_475474 [Jimgerdemannia flammicorona]